ncbi:MAG: GNAT family N-acetyltransferase [Chitinophagaceae bacterium]
MILVRINSDSSDFKLLAKELEADLALRDGDDHLRLAELNKVTNLNHVVVAYSENEPAACGGLRPLSPGEMEVKRMYVRPQYRRQGFAYAILNELELWCRQLYVRSIFLETGKNQPEAISFYLKNGYSTIPLFGIYSDSSNSICFHKDLSG